ncbi:MAG TPA: hypothetical protein VGG05_25125 [Pseudonocardiaceae bacterium]|jgi:hypothetical protein
MRKLWSLCAIALVAMGLVVGMSGPAAALGGETLGCRVVPVLGDPPCPPATPPVSGFCGNSDQCAINVRNTNQSIPVTVTLTQGGASETLSSPAIINPFCGSRLC